MCMVIITGLWVSHLLSSYHIWTRLRVIVCKLGYAVCNNKGQAGDGPGACSCLPCQRLIVIHPDGLEGSIVEAVCTPAARIVRTNKCSNNSDNGNNSRDDTDDDDDDDSNAFQLILSLVRAGQVLSLQGSLSYASLKVSGLANVVRLTKTIFWLLRCAMGCKCICTCTKYSTLQALGMHDCSWQT